MRWYGLVIIPLETTDVEKKVEAMLAPFDFNADVEPYREYFDARQVAAWKQQWATDDLALIAEHLKETVWGKHRETGLDEIGLYEVSTFNPLAEWDSWHFDGGDYMFGEARWEKCLEGYETLPQPVTCNMCRVAELPEGFLMYSVVTPDGKWQDRYICATELFGTTGSIWRELTEPEQAKAVKIWEARFQAILKVYEDYLAVGIGFHS